MEISITTLTLLAVTFVTVGLVLLTVWPMLFPKHSAPKGPTVTVKDGASIVTVRNAGGGDFSISFSSKLSADEDVIPASAMSDTEAENEITVLDELRDPNTPAERKAAIEKELLDIGYKLIDKRASVQNNQTEKVEPAEQVSKPERKEASSKPGEPDDEPSEGDHPEGVDEGFGDMEPQFDDFFPPSE